MTDVGFVKMLIQKYGSTPSPADIEEAVNTYLEDHPEAVAPIDDAAGEGDTGKLWSADKVATETESLKEALANKAPAIVGSDGEYKYSFNDVVSPTTIEYAYSQYAFGNARYADKLNYMPITSFNDTLNTLQVSVVDRTLIANGTPTESVLAHAIDANLPVNAPAGDYKFHIEVDKGSSTIGFGQNIIFRGYYADGTEGDLFTQTVKDTSVVVDKTIAKELRKIRLTFYFTSKNTYSNHRIWIGMYPADTTFTDLGVPVTDQSQVTAELENIVTPSIIDTVQHKCSRTYKVDTKTYIDNKFYSVYNGKTLSILGDSISTYEGYIPEGNATYYPEGTVQDVSDTWWYKLMTALGMTLNVNNSWSGTRVTTTNGETSAGCMSRTEALGTNPDVIIVWMGINDFNNEVSLGTYDGSTALPQTTTTFREAYAIMLNKILTAYKTSEVWVCTLPQCERNGEETFPEINGNDVALIEFNKAIVELANAFGVKVLDHNKCGLTYQNMSVYNPDELHPNKAGHSLVANNDIWQMDAFVRTRY